SQMKLRNDNLFHLLSKLPIKSLQKRGELIRKFGKCPSSQPLDKEVNLLNWNIYLYTREFPSIDQDHSLRHVSKLLTYPITIGFVLHQN
ncbi:11700_t:CDS:2, partial [Gigaspora margarita]